MCKMNSRDPLRCDKRRVINLSNGYSKQSSSANNADEKEKFEKF